MSSLSLSDASGFLRPQTHTHNVQCSGAGDCMTLFPHWKDSSKPYQGRRGAGCWTRSLLSCEGIPCWTCRNSSRFSCAPVLMKEEQCGQTGPATLPILTFSSQKLDASDWFFSGFSLPAWVSHSAGGTVPRLGGHQSCSLRAELTDVCRQGRLWCPGGANPACAVLHFSVTWVSPNTNQRG